MLIAQRAGSDLRAPENWPDVKQVLIQDMLSGNRQLFEFAFHSFTKIGKDDSLPDLIKLLHTHGTKMIAVKYLNSKHEPLREAAIEWAHKNDYNIIKTAEAVETWDWGGW